MESKRKDNTLSPPTHLKMATRVPRKRFAASVPLDTDPIVDASERQVPDRQVPDRPDGSRSRTERVARPDADSTSVVDAVNAEERAFMEHERARLQLRRRRRSIEFFTYPDGSTTTKVTYGEPR